LDRTRFWDSLRFLKGVIGDVGDSAATGVDMVGSKAGGHVWALLGLMNNDKAMELCHDCNKVEP